MAEHLSDYGTVEYTHVEMTQVVLPTYTNVLGTVFGGQVMSWIDICAAVSAQRHAKAPVVTASFDSVHFIKPIKHSQVVVLKSQVNAVFKTSMEVGVVVYAEEAFTGERSKAIRAYCTFVAVDKTGKPIELPELLVQSDEDKRRHQEASKRREQRLLLRKTEKRHFHAKK